MGVFLHRLCKSNIFGARAVFGMDASHVFPQSVLSVIPLTGSVMIWYPKAALDVQWGVLFALCLSQPFWGPSRQSCTAGPNFPPGPSLKDSGPMCNSYQQPHPVHVLDREV